MDEREADDRKGESSVVERVDLAELRDRINDIDRQILTLYRQRMDVACQIAEYKRAHGLPVLDAAREREKLAQAEGAVPDDMREHAAALMTLLMETSRARQHAVLEASANAPENA